MYDAHFSIYLHNRRINVAYVSQSGSLTALLAEDNDIFTDAESTAKAYFSTHFTNLTLFEPGTLFVPTTSTATRLEGADAGSQDTIVLDGTNLLGANGTITHAELVGVDGGSSTFDGSLTWVNNTGITGGTLTAIDITAPDGSRIVGTGTFTVNSTGVISGNYKDIAFHSTTGFIAEFEGSINVATHRGTIKELFIHDGGGNSFTFQGPFSAQAFFDTMANEPTIGDVIAFGMLLGDLVTGTAGVDELLGFAGNDRLLGLGGNDTLDGGTGNDSLVGGLGDDIYIVDSATDKPTELAGQGTDTVRSTAANFTLGLNLENLALLGTANINGAGNAGDNTLVGNSGNNTLNGGLGNDTMVGDTGDDTFIFNNALDIAMEDPGEGSDTVVIAYNNTVTGVPVTIDMDDYADIENATITGTGLYNIQGNALDNTLTGNASVNTLIGGAGDDVLNGGAGADVMNGGSDDDTYYVDTLADQIIDSGGNDTIVYNITTGSFTVGGGMENLTLTGVAAQNATGDGSVNTLTGNGGVNTLNGLAGADVMVGRAGNDIYIVDDTGDTVTEAANEGLDTVRSSASFTLGANVEALLLTGAANIDGTGSGGANTITGNSGDNSLDGGAGLDKLAGGAGNDTYIIDVIMSGTTARLEDTATEAANAGNDAVVLRTAGLLGLVNPVTFTLGANIETFNASATGLNKFHLTGNALANTLIGNDFDNTLNGGAGADNLSGGDGDDTLIVDNAGDIVSGGLGFDTIRASVSFDLGTSVDSEHLVLTGNAAINGTGHAGDNEITGNSYGNTLDGAAGADTLVGLGGADVLLGGLDNDILDGGAGADTLTGGAGVDTYVFHGTEAGSSLNADLINGFATGVGGDAIDISDVLVGYSGGSVDAWVHLTVVGSDTIVSIDKNGAAPGGLFYNVATIVGVTGLDADQMVTDGNLIVL